MAGVNKAIIVGNLGRDPEIRYTQNGLAVANFTMATSERFGQDREERTEWHRIVAFGRLAEICGEYLAKGRQVYIEGRIQTRDWEDKDGNKRYTTEIVANQMVMLGRADGQGGGQRAPQRQGGGGQYGGGRQSDGGRQGGGQGSGGGQGGNRDNDYGGGDYGGGGYNPPGDDEIPF